MDGGKCLITGCALAFPQDEIAYWGDLHEFEGVYIFNAVVHENIEPALITPAPHDKMLFVGNTPIVQHGGVFILPKRDVTFNNHAQKHLTHWRTS
jgi:hypothetical protein